MEEVDLIAGYHNLTKIFCIEEIINKKLLEQITIPVTMNPVTVVLTHIRKLKKFTKVVDR